MSAAPCRCRECRDLDRTHPTEGEQLMLLDVPAPTVSPEAVTALLRRTRMRIANEAGLQQSIEDALAGAGYAFEREARLSAADRIDFLVAGGIGIEAKARYAKRAIYRQLERYAARPEIAALILVTGTAMGLPAAIGGKPVFFVSTGRAAL